MALSLERAAAIRAEIKRRLSERQEPVSTGPAPRYDAVYFEGAAWLDRLAQE